jgi:hypothetical protein
MIAIQKTQPDAIAYIMAVAILFILLGRYSRQAMEWLLMKLYEFFVLRGPIAIK